MSTLWTYAQIFSREPEPEPEPERQAQSVKSQSQPRYSRASLFKAAQTKWTAAKEAGQIEEVFKSMKDALQKLGPKSIYKFYTDTL